MLFWKSISERLILRVIDLAHVELCQSHRLCYNRANWNAQGSSHFSRFVAFSMDLNKASQKQIMEVQLIGEVLSKRIVKHRPFSSWAEVKTLAQIGDKRLQKLKAVFTIEIAEAASDDEEFQLVEKVKSAAERTITEASATEQRTIWLVQVFKFRIKC